MFFFEGVKVLYKVALAVLNLAFSSPASQKECPGYMTSSRVDFPSDSSLSPVSLPPPHQCRFFELTRKLRNLPIAITHEDILIPEVNPSDYMPYMVV